MWKLFAELDPEAGAKLWAALDAHLATVKQRAGNAEQPIERLAADALVEVVTGSKPTTGDRPAVPEVSVLIDWATLRAGSTTTRSTSSPTAPPFPWRRLGGCAAKPSSSPSSSDRTGGPSISAGRCGQRRASSGACCGPCTARAGTRTATHRSTGARIHHVHPWEHGGRTDLDNLLPLCSKHHHLVHDGGWTLTMPTDRSVGFTNRDHGVTIDGPPVTTRATSPPRAA
jgi:hypothetical protein